MEVRKISINATNMHKTESTSASEPQSSVFTNPIQMSAWTEGCFLGLDFSNIQPHDKKSTEERAGEIYDKAASEAHKEGRAVNIFDLDRVRQDKIKQTGWIPESEVSIDELIKQAEIDYDYIAELSATGTELTKEQKNFKDKIRPLIAQLQNGKITVKEFNEQKKKLLTKKVIDEQSQFIHKTDTTLTPEQLAKTEKLYSETAETDIVTFKVAKKHAKGEEQKQEIEMAFVENAPKLRQEIVKEASKELPEKLDEESIKKYTEATEVLEVKERIYAKAIINNADYLTEEQKEQKLKVIGKTVEEIKNFAHENTQKITEQIIEYRKEQEYIKHQENQKIQSIKQENLKEEHKIKEFKKTKLDNKENRFKKMINYLLSILKKQSKTENIDDKNIQTKTEQAQSMKTKIDNKLDDIQSQKRLLAKEMEMNELNNSIALSDMPDDFLRYKASLSLV